MKRSVFNPLQFRLTLLRINIVNTWQTETAHFGDAWGNVISTVMFTITYLVFVTVIYANVDRLAGYTRDEMLFLILIGQVSFYSVYAWSFNNVQTMIQSVNDGSFDMLLAKPLPSLFYTTVRNISILSVLRDGIPAISFVILAINWSQIEVTGLNFLIGVVVFICGQIAINGFLFLMGLPVFWFGQAADILNLSYPFLDMGIPYEGVGQQLRFGLTLLIPSLVPASLVASVMLHKSDPLWGLALAVIAALLLFSFKSWGWRQALKNYTSASS